MKFEIQNSRWETSEEGGNPTGLAGEGDAPGWLVQGGGREAEDFAALAQDAMRRRRGGKSGGGTKCSRTGSGKGGGGDAGRGGRDGGPEAGFFSALAENGLVLREMRKDGHCLFHSIVHILSEAGWADRVRARLKIELDAAPLRSASCRLLLATVEALPASGEDGVGRILEQEAQAIGRGGWGGGLSLTVLCEALGCRIGVVEYREGKYGPAHVQSQLDKGQAKYVYPIGVHSGEYLGTLLNRTSASGCGFHFDVLEAPRRGKRPHAGSPVAPLPEAPELAGDGERSLRGCLEVGDELAAALAAAKELLTPQEAVTSRAVLEQTLACACKPPGDVLRQHLVVAVSRLPPTVLYDGRRRAPATAEEIASSLRDVNGDLLLDGIFSPFELLRLVIGAGYGRAAARFAFFFPGGGLPASRTEAEGARLAAASAAMAELPPDAQLSTLSAEERSRAIGASLCGAIAHLGEQRAAELTALFLEGCDANGLLELLRSADAGRLLSSLHARRADGARRSRHQGVPPSRSASRARAIRLHHRP